MTDKLLTVTLNLNTNKQTKLSPNNYRFSRKLLILNKYGTVHVMYTYVILTIGKFKVEKKYLEIVPKYMIGLTVGAALE